MLEVGWSEILVIALILIIVVGPKDLPPMLRTFGRMATRLRGMANEFKGQFDQALREAELDDVRKGLGEVSKLNPTNSLRDAINPIRKLGEEIKSDLRKASDMSTPAATTAADELASAEESQPSEITPLDTLTDLLPATDPTPVAKPAEPVAIPAVATTPAAPVAAAAAVPATQKIAEPAPAITPVADKKTVSEAAIAAPSAAVAAPKTRKAPVRTKDAAVAAVAAETTARKAPSRKKAAATEATSDVAADVAKPKKPATRKKSEKAGDA